MRKFSLLGSPRVLASLCVIAALLLTACTPATPSGGNSSAATTASNAPAAGEKIELRFWAHQNNSFNAADQAMIDKFMQENPNVTVKFETFPWDVFIQTIQTSVPAGNAADVIQLPGGYTCRFAAGGQLLEVPEDLMTLGEASETFFAAPLGG